MPSSALMGAHVALRVYMTTPEYPALVSVSSSLRCSFLTFLVLWETPVVVPARH